MRFRVVVCERDAPSDEMDAPESLNSSDPIWMGKTRSCGRMLGMWLAANFRGSGAEKGSSAAVVDVVDEPGLDMVRQSKPRETQQLNSSFFWPLPRLSIQTGPSKCQRRASAMW